MKIISYDNKCIDVCKDDILVPPNPLLPLPIAAHPDMNMCVIDNVVFTTRHMQFCEDQFNALGYKVIYVSKKLGNEYPDDAMFNCAVIGKNVVMNTKTAAFEIISYCGLHNYNIIDVKQGYANCSTLCITDNAAITADIGIYNALVNNNIDTLLITPGNIGIKNYNYGFIGGAGGMLNSKTLLFFGRISAHTDFLKIKDFAYKFDVAIKETATPLYDYGGLFIL